MSVPSFTVPQELPVATCYRHPDRATRIYCRRCGRPICGECMVQAPVGFQCPECVRAGQRETRQRRTWLGGRSATNPHRSWLSGQTATNPRVTSIVLIVINVVVWGVLQVAGRWQDRLLSILGLMPTGLCTIDAQPGVYLAGMRAVACHATQGTTWTPGVADGAWWQIVTTLFTHVNILHVGLNCLTLFFLGPPLESLLGRARFLATYFLSGLAGSLAVYWFAAVQSQSIGASGALFGLMGALIILFWRRHLDVRQILMWLGINLVMTFVSRGISWQAHVGGLLGGIAVAVAWAFVPSRRTTTAWLAVAGLVVLLTLGFVGRTLVLT